MDDVLDELKKWVPVFFYDKKREEVSVADVIELFWRSILHVVLSIPGQLIFILLFVVLAVHTPQTLWETRLGEAVGYTIALFTVLTPFRITRHLSYLLYRQMFKDGLYLS